MVVARSTVDQRGIPARVRSSAGSRDSSRNLAASTPWRSDWWTPCSRPTPRRSARRSMRSATPGPAPASESSCSAGSTRQSRSPTGARARAVSFGRGPRHAGARVPDHARRAAQLGSAELRRLLETDETQVSRTGRRLLLDSGLVTRRKVGRQVFWQLSPRGRRALEQPPEPTPPDSASFWLEAIRRGFEGAAGDEPGLARRESIRPASGSSSQPSSSTTPVASRPPPGRRSPLARTCPSRPWRRCSRRSTTWPGAAVSTSWRPSASLRRIEPLTSSSAPPPSTTGSGAWWRRSSPCTSAVPTASRSDGASGWRCRSSASRWTRSRRRSTRSSPRPCDRGAEWPALASLRALTDLEIWRTLRDQGATPDAAVEQASAAVERWLEGHPAR